MMMIEKTYSFPFVAPVIFFRVASCETVCFFAFCPWNCNWSTIHKMPSTNIPMFSRVFFDNHSNCQVLLSDDAFGGCRGELFRGWWRWPPFERLHLAYQKVTDGSSWGWKVLATHQHCFINPLIFLFKNPWFTHPRWWFQGIFWPSTDTYPGDSHSLPPTINLSSLTVHHRSRNFSGEI